jgi:ubiquinone/menaquinone biosynthesis C-methylase UbiE
MAAAAHYPIRGGVPGRERLRVLSRVMRPSTTALLIRAGIQPGMACLDIGCGGGDVAFDMAAMVAPGGLVVGTDIDDTKLELARAEAAGLGLSNLQFLHADALRESPGDTFDLVHARFLLSHLADPAAALANMRRALRPGGTLVVEDVDFTGYFCHPPHAAFDRYIELYRAAAYRKGGDPEIGLRLPRLVACAGFIDVQMNVTQHASTEGEVKMISALTMENIVDAVLAAGLADRIETDRLVAELYDFARTPGTIGSTPRIFEVWARRPATRE